MIRGTTPANKRPSNFLSGRLYQDVPGSSFKGPAGSGRIGLLQVAPGTLNVYVVRGMEVVYAYLLIADQSLTHSGIRLSIMFFHVGSKAAASLPSLITQNHPPILQELRCTIF